MKLLSWIGVLFCSVLLMACGGGGGNASSPDTLYTTAPSSLVLSAGSAQQFTIGGGRPFYSAVSDNSAVVVSGVNSNQLTLGAVAPGTARISLRDSAGSSVIVAVTVPDIPVARLFTSAASSVSVGVGVSTSFNIGGGAAPYAVTSSNASVATVSHANNTFTVTGVAVGIAQVVVTDNLGAAVSIGVTTLGSPPLAPLALTPNNATAIIGDVLRATITGGQTPYRVSVENQMVAAADVENGRELKITLLRVGSTVVTVLDADNRSVPYTLTSNAATPGIRLSPNAVTVSECDTGTIPLTLYGAALGTTNVFSSDVKLLTAEIRASTVTVRPMRDLTVASSLNGDALVTISAVDSTGALGTSVVTIKKSVLLCQ
jgi:hypothetical protein